MSLNFYYPRYLEAKRSVDDRSLNQGVLQSLREALVASPKSAPLRILDIGGGTGTMLHRLVEWKLVDAADYTLVDTDSESLGRVDVKAFPGFTVHPVHADISDFLLRTETRFDLIIAHAVLDLIELAEFLPLLWKRCAGGAHFWFTINFDGESAFLPAHPDDHAIWNAYHSSMDRRPGASHAGQALFTELGQSGATIERAGSSDWVVHAVRGAYEQDEAYFLRHIVHTVDQELANDPPISKHAFANWLQARRIQIQNSELIYIAHQLDFFGSPPAVNS